MWYNYGYYNSYIKKYILIGASYMEKVFTGIAFTQVLLFVTIVFGVSNNILKNDLFVKLTKITSLIIFLLSIYIVVK